MLTLTYREAFAYLAIACILSFELGTIVEYWAGYARWEIFLREYRAGKTKPPNAQTPCKT